MNWKSSDDRQQLEEKEGNPGNCDHSNHSLHLPILIKHIEATSTSTIYPLSLKFGAQFWPHFENFALPHRPGRAWQPFLAQWIAKVLSAFIPMNQLPAAGYAAAS